LEGLDFLMVELAKRDMKAILVLNNYWQWSGGMIQYVGWETGQPVLDPDQTGDWRAFMFQSAEFYGNQGANEKYRGYIRDLVKRVNTISGIPYVDDPAIMSWQLANEPRPAPDSRENAEHARLFVEWVHSTCEFIQDLDPNHLVSTGNEGYNGSAQSWEIYREAHESPHVDYLTFHIWPKNWGWYDAANPDSTFERALSNTFTYFAEHIDMARQMNKPTVLEEFGLERDGGSFSPEVPTTYRDEYLSQLFSAVVDSALAGSPMAGLNFWAWGGEARASHEDYLWRVGDSFMGDPPQEPQGLNSVFSSDRSTLEVFRKYNAALEKLN
jgi:mannan endo-1,4-beta-mannosidase